MGLQADGYPYVYYPPSYGYAQSSYNPYNPYNPYIPGAVMGADDPIIGTQQYFSNPSFQPPACSPTTYIPLVVMPNADAVPPCSSLIGIGTSVPPNRQGGSGTNYSQPRVSSNGGTTSQGAASSVSAFESSQTTSSEASTDMSLSRQPSSLWKHYSDGLGTIALLNYCSQNIKYNVWSSTPNGNKKLHSAYEDAQKRNCPIFFFFSRSGDFGSFGNSSSGRSSSFEKSDTRRSDGFGFGSFGGDSKPFVNLSSFN